MEIGCGCQRRGWGADYPGGSCSRPWRPERPGRWRCAARLLAAGANLPLASATAPAPNSSAVAASKPATAAADALTSQPATAATQAAGAPDTSLVVVARDERVIQGLRINLRWLGEMIDKTVTSLTGCADAPAAWGQFARPGQKILLKFTRLSGDTLGTNAQMLEALLRSLELAGHKRQDILVADCPEAAYAEGLPVLPDGWGRQTVQLGEDLEVLRRYLDGVDVIINVPYLTDHNLVGVSCAMTNVSLPFIRHPGRYYGQRLHETIVAICASSAIRAHVKLTLVNAMRCVYEGGPLVSTDRVAYDSSVWAPPTWWRWTVWRWTGWISTGGSTG